MRKTIKRSDPEFAPEKASWLDVSTIAQVEVSSEDAQYPIESAFAEGDLDDPVALALREPAQNGIRGSE